MRCPRILFVCLLTSVAIKLPKAPSSAQVTPDQTLGSEASIVRSDVSIEGAIGDLIEGGATRGENLFHSFSDFSVEASDRIYFASPENIATILSRVTGSSVSSINGLLGTTGSSNAALIFMNPNGIVFGENAALDTQGAFTATTATSIQLGENGLFSAVAPESDQLLSISPSAFFFNELASASSEISIEGAQDFQVMNGELFLLVSEDVTVSRSEIEAPDSQVKIVAVGSAIAAGIAENGDIVLNESADGGNILIEDGSIIDVRSPRGGSITLVSDDIQVLSDSLLLSGVQPTLDQSSSDNVEDAGVGEASAEGAANFVELNATGAVRISGDGTILESSVLKDTDDQSEGVFIRADSIRVDEAAQIYSITLGNGSAGDVVLEANADVVIDGANVTTSIEAGGAGQSDNILLSGENVYIFGNSLIGTFTAGAGDAGRINIAAADVVELSGVGNNEPTIVSIVVDGEGDGGDIDISTNSFKAIGDVFITTSTLSTFAAGQAGDISIEASEQALLGAERSATVLGILSSSTGEEASGQGGNIEIRSPSVEVLNGFQINTGTLGEADAGNVKIEASDSLRIDGSNPDITSSTIGSVTTRSSTGRAGEVEVIAGNLEATNGGIISSSTTGKGDAGVVRIDVDGTATFDGFDSISSATSGIRSLSLGSGRGGEIQLSATELNVTNGAQLIAASDGEGDAGSVTVDVLEAIRLDGGSNENPSTIGSGVFQGGSGSGGEVNISATNLAITNGGNIGAETSGRGDAGNVSVDILETLEIDGVSPINGSSPSNIGSGVQPSGVGQGGEVVVSATNIDISNGGQIDTSVFGVGEAGNVMITASEAIRIDGVNPITGMSPSNVGSGIQSTQLAEESQGGTVTITTGSLEVTNGGSIDTTSFGRGDAGRIVINASETVRLDGVDPITGDAVSTITSSVQTNAIGDGGTIEINAVGLEIIDGAQIDTSVFGEGDAGDVLLNIDGTILVSGQDSVTGETPSSIGTGVAEEGSGNGGSLDIAATNVYVVDNSQITAANTGSGDAGRILLRVSEQVRIEDNGDIVTRSISGSGGEIIIQSESVLLQNDGDIRTIVDEGEGTSGDLTIEADYVVALDDSDILAFSTDGRGGDVDLSRTVLFSQNLNTVTEEISEDTLFALDGNERVDVNASGGITSGQILINDASFVEDDLTELPDTLVDTDALLASACVANRQDGSSTFVLRGSDRTPLSPVDPLANRYSLGTVQTIPNADQSQAIQEPEGVYQTSDGRLLMSHQCK